MAVEFKVGDKVATTVLIPDTTCLFHINNHSGDLRLNENHIKYRRNAVGRIHTVYHSSSIIYKTWYMVEHPEPAFGINYLALYEVGEVEATQLAIPELHDPVQSWLQNKG